MDTCPTSPGKCNNSTSNIKLKLIILYVYNWIMLFYVLIGESESIPWKYGQIKYIIEDEIPNVPKLENNKSFEFDFCCLNIIFNLLLLTAIIFREKQSRLCLYLALGWNLYELELHVINMMIFLYDAYDTVMQSWTLMTFLVVGVFLTALHISLLIDCTFYYNELNDHENEILDSVMENNDKTSNQEGEDNNINLDGNSSYDDLDYVIKRILLNNETKDFQKYLRIYKELFNVDGTEDLDLIGEEVKSNLSNSEYDELSDYKSDMETDDSGKYCSNYKSVVPDSVSKLREDDFEEYVGDVHKKNYQKKYISNSLPNFVTNTTNENEYHKNVNNDSVSDTIIHHNLRNITDEDDYEIYENTFNYYQQEYLISKSESSSCCDSKCECGKTDDDENNKIDNDDKTSNKINKIFHTKL